MSEGFEGIEFHEEVVLNKPIMVAAFRGWNDAGDAASFAAQHLAQVWGGKLIASIDPEEFYDFQAVRPHVELTDGFTRKITWPANDLLACRMPGSEHDVLLLIGTEPSHRWRTFSRLIVNLAAANDTQLVITLGALLADVPHSRPVHITGTAGDPELIDKLGLQRSRYEGPTGIVGVLHDALGAAGIGSASLWAAVPHYLGVSPNPKAALALVDKAVSLTKIGADVGELERATQIYEETVGQIVASDEDVQGYVRLLEERADERTEDEIDVSDLPSGEALAEELERFLRENES
jgi:proteasome assembly chaperone (PAC2) family protein